MPKIIFTSRFIRNKKTVSNLLRYIATREGAEPLRRYVDYLAHRPGAVRAAPDHGLWNASDEPISLSHAMEEITNHPGNIFSHVVSLKREDADRLGYNDVSAWRNLIISKLPVISDAMKIPLSELRWYAAYHEKENNPHVHIMVFSQNPKLGYLTNIGIEKMRSAFATEIFKHDMLHVYEQKDLARGQLKAFAEQRLRELSSALPEGDPVIARLLRELGDRLRGTSGKKQYGYLRPEHKQIVDEIVNRLAADPRIAEMYRLWCELAADVKRVYASEVPPPLALRDEKTFKSIKNMVIQQAIALPFSTISAELHVTSEPVRSVEPVTSSALPAAPSQQWPMAEAGALLRSLARLIQHNYNEHRWQFERAVERKFAQRTMQKQQSQGQKIDRS